MQQFANPYLFQNPFYSQNGNNILQNTPNFYNQPQQPVGISGKYVNDFAEITASDIPMNGQPAVFAKADKSEIQIREWNPNGQIVTTLYKPCFDVPEVKQEPIPTFDVKAEVIEPIFERISALEEKLDRLNRPSTVNRNKKDGE